ncbi:SGNH/GDSL hydrolase family protein [Streptomyces sp. ICN441]|uniref:GDSL family lipase n=1 Tax=Streptomyces tirandamycinicus TaxID=2174846 RepID=A0A2S1SVY8_9ACTN|nr:MULTISPECIES: SGNH/GDSL hydrolase family protein [Streptomyces]AWI30582.1 GDSL family lipase [Streptomyces tirandamycinicus]TFE48733.1 SGNH/GDSL hydrolase family protein [Streptomyces sp. ICN441]
MLPSAAHATPHHARSLDYVALGDSYAAAPGVPEQIDPACARSSSNYPHLVAARNKARLTDVTCSGATTADLAVAQGAVPAQYDALSRKTDLVTVSIGGNDIGFSKVLGRCAALAAGAPSASPCRDDLTQGGADQVEQSIAATAPKISRVIAEIRSRAPRARILMVGYPSLFPDSGVGCTSPGVPIAAGDFAFLRDKTKALNAMIARRAELGGATYVDTYTPTINHDMCRPVGERWIENLAPQPQAAPVHPNAQGEQAMAKAVNRALSRCGGAHRV